ncbi:MAG: hypothetical protein WAV32_03960 [Halobacteriota archaeon]
MIEGKRYEIKVTQMIITSMINGETKGISVNFEFEDSSWMEVLVDLDKGEITEIGPMIKPQGRSVKRQ